MSILEIILVIVIVGVVLYLINKFIPMDAKIKTILNWAVVIFLIIWLLKILGAWNWLSSAKV